MHFVNITNGNFLLFIGSKYQSNLNEIDKFEQKSASNVDSKGLHGWSSTDNSSSGKFLHVDTTGELGKKDIRSNTRYICDPKITSKKLARTDTQLGDLILF